MSRSGRTWWSCGGHRDTARRAGGTTFHRGCLTGTIGRATARNPLCRRSPESWMAARRAVRPDAPHPRLHVGSEAPRFRPMFPLGRTNLLPAPEVRVGPYAAPSRAGSSGPVVHMNGTKWLASRHDWMGPRFLATGRRSRPTRAGRCQADNFRRDVSAYGPRFPGPTPDAPAGAAGPRRRPSPTCSRSCHPIPSRARFARRDRGQTRGPLMAAGCVPADPPAWPLRCATASCPVNHAARGPLRRPAHEYVRAGRSCWAPADLVTTRPLGFPSKGGSGKQHFRHLVPGSRQAPRTLLMLQPHRYLVDCTRQPC
jgi:hypothetical protein